MKRALQSVTKRAFRVLGYEIRRVSESPQTETSAKTAARIVAEARASVARDMFSIGVPPMTWAATSKFLYFQRMFDIIKDTDGDVVECGVGRGNSLLYLALLVKDEMKGRKLWGFDSFEGFPEPSEQDRSSRAPREGEHSGVDVSDIENLLINSGLDVNFLYTQLSLVKGFFSESLSKYAGDTIALLQLDVDLYDSYLTTLKYFYPRVAEGGVVLFDEYLGWNDNIQFPGAQIAIDEYLVDSKPLITRDKTRGTYYIVKRQS